MKGRIPRRSIFFHPTRPPPTHVLEHVRQHAGWDVASSAETADWCVLYQDATWVTLPDDDPYAEVAPTWINGRCRDISKRKVEQVFADVFGYPLAVDPLTYQGICLRKSNRNYVKNVTMVQCPIPVAERNEELVYERVVDSRVPGLGTIELPAYVVEGEVVSTLNVIRPDWISAGTYVDGALDTAVVYPTSIYSEQELAQIARFCAAMGLDYGKLDIIRDNADQRIYILDANTTPGFGPRHPRPKQFLVHQLAQAFFARYPPRSASAIAPSAAGPPSGTNGHWDEATNLAARVEAQAGRIAQLEVEVGTLGAGIARVLADDHVAHRHTRKKTSKKRKT
jgi:hypothetical protein